MGDGGTVLLSPPVSGSAGDTFVVAGWAKGDAAPLTESTTYPRQYGVVATFNYTDGTKKAVAAQFNPDVKDFWQYSSEVMVAEKDYTSITVAVTYDHNVNEVMFDGIQLYKEQFGTSYTYDGNGNVVSVVDLQQKNTTYTYDTKGNVKEVKENGVSKMKKDRGRRCVFGTLLPTSPSPEGMQVETINRQTRIYDYTYDRISALTGSGSIL